MYERRERREERRDEPPQRMLVPRVVDEVLRQAREALVVEPELVREPARRARAAPPGERDRVDVDQAEGGDAPGRRERASRPDGARPRTREIEPAPEEVRARRAAGRGAPRGGRPGGSRRRRGRAAGSARRRRRARRRPARASRRAPGGTQRPPVADDEHEHRRASSTSFQAETTSSARAADAGAVELGHHEVVEREPDDEDVQDPDGPALHAGPDRDERHPPVDDPHRVREERRELLRPERVEHVVEAACAQQAVAARRRPAASGRTAAACADRAGSSRFGVVTKTRPATRQSSSTNRRCPSRPPATCSTTAFEKPRSNSPSANGSSRPSARTARHLRERSREAVELGVADRRDPLRPRVERLEEVVARAAAERRVGDADVDDRRLRARAGRARGRGAASARGSASRREPRRGAASR